MTGSTVVVLGGGVGGLVTANELRHRLPQEHRVVLVDREGRHIFWPSLLWLQVGLREPQRFVRDLGLLESTGIEVVKGQVDAMDPERQAALEFVAFMLERRRQRAKMESTDIFEREGRYGHAV